MKQLIVVEDSNEHAEDARTALRDFDVLIARTYAEFTTLLDSSEVSAVLSDLYFPTGMEGSTKHDLMKAEACGILDAYIQGIDLPNPIATVLREVFGTGMSGKGVDDYFEMFRNDSLVSQEGFRNIVRRKWEDYETLLEYRSLLDNMIADAHLLPSGIFVYRKCGERGLPCIIVTSEYHHGVGFQPFVSHVGGYFDRLSPGGEKPWAEAAMIASGKVEK